jgi:hypothetical protein
LGSTNIQTEAPTTEIGAGQEHLIELSPTYPTNHP